VVTPKAIRTIGPALVSVKNRTSVAEMDLTSPVDCRVNRTGLISSLLLSYNKNSRRTLSIKHFEGTHNFVE